MKHLLFLLMFLPLLVFGQRPEDYKHNDSLYVDDYANVFSQTQRVELDRVIRDFHDTAQLSVVTIKTFGDYEPGDFAVRLGRTWGVGGKSNNGLIIVIGIDDHKIFAATGGGIQGDLPDVTVSEFQREYAIPKYKQGDYYGGTYDLVRAYIAQLSPSAKALREKEEAVQAQLRRERAENLKEGLLQFLLWLGVAALIGLPFYLRYRKIRAKKRLLQQKLEREEQARWKKRHAEQQKMYAEQQLKSDLAQANTFLSSYPKSSELREKYPHKTAEIDEYKKARERLRQAITLNNLALLANIILVARRHYANITYVAPKYTEHKTSDYKTEKKQEKKKDSDNSVLGAAIAASVLSSSDDDSSSSTSYSSSSSSDDSSSSFGSSFGGGSFDGGGGGSSW